jgi:hypothetical protein
MSDLVPWLFFPVFWAVMWHCAKPISRTPPPARGAAQPQSR